MSVQCDLCPKRCVIPEGGAGDCRIRVNLDGKLRAVTYGYPSAVHVDPIEKKPLFHMLPGSSIFSVATVGCNLHCRNCQNWEISQCDPADADAMHLPPETLPDLARRYGCRSVAYTYTEPVVYYEYTLDSSRRVKAAGLRNVLVTAGYLNEKPLRELCRYTDAANIDLKAFSDRFYRTVCDATLAPVLKCLELSKSLGVHVEVTNLLIPTLNDRDTDIRKLCEWIRDHLGRETPLHFSRFFPRYHLRRLPPTPGHTLDRAYEIAKSVGLDYVYIGNILRKHGSDTFCPACGKLLIRRVGYRVLENHLRDGKCPACGKEIYGIWK